MREECTPYSFNRPIMKLVSSQPQIPIGLTNLSLFVNCTGYLVLVILFCIGPASDPDPAVHINDPFFLGLLVPTLLLIAVIVISNIVCSRSSRWSLKKWVIFGAIVVQLLSNIYFVDIFDNFLMMCPGLFLLIPIPLDILIFYKLIAPQQKINFTE